jgi:hypothetical protein
MTAREPAAATVPITIPGGDPDAILISEGLARRTYAQERDGNEARSR